MTGRNTRSLDDIAADIHALERSSIFDIGERLIEAEAVCDHGQWLPWLEQHFEWSDDTARRYMSAARLVLKFCKLRNLPLPASTIYGLAELDEHQAEAVGALTEATANGKRISIKQGRRIIQTVCLQARFGDYPEVTLDALDAITHNDGCCTHPNFALGWRKLDDSVSFHFDPEQQQEVAAALKASKPTTEEAGITLIRSFKEKFDAAIVEPGTVEIDAAAEPVEIDNDAADDGEPVEIDDDDGQVATRRNGGETQCDGRLAHPALLVDDRQRRHRRITLAVAAQKGVGGL